MAGSTSDDCVETYAEGTLVTLTARAADGASTFGGWSGACAGTGTCRVTMNQAQTVTATFTRGLADLIVESLTHSPPDPTTDDLITLIATVGNIGQGVAEASSLELKVGGESVPPVFDIPSLVPGQRHVVLIEDGQQPFAVGRVEIGEQHVLVCGQTHGGAELVDDASDGGEQSAVVGVGQTAVLHEQAERPATVALFRPAEVIVDLGSDDEAGAFRGEGKLARGNPKSEIRNPKQIRMTCHE